MSVIVAGTYRVPPDAIEALRAPMEAVVSATRAEDGCLVYSYAFDLMEPGLIRVFEIWRDMDVHHAHFATLHMQAWVTERARHGLYDRQISVYEVASERAV